MNTQRTYGIEIEMVSSISRDQVMNTLNEAFANAGLRHRVRTGSYGHDRNATNFRVWNLKTDGSIIAPSSHPHAMELVTPVMRGPEGLDILKLVLQTIAPFASVNSSTGLHVHHGVTSGELLKIAKTYMASQDALYQMVPPSRRNNRHCRKWHPVNPVESDVRSWYRNNVGTRYVGLNLESFWMRGTVEFRMAAGTVTFQKISNWVVFTQMLIERADLFSAYGSGLSFDQVIQILSSTPVADPTLATGSTITYKRPSARKSAIVWDMAQDGHSRYEIVERLCALYGAKPYRVDEQMRRARLTKAASSTASPAPLAGDERDAIDWAKSRKDRFAVYAI